MPEAADVNEPRRVCVFTANRADYSKLRPLMLALRDDSRFALSVVVMGSHLIDDFGNTWRQIKADGLPIDYQLHTIVAGGDQMSMVESVGLALMKLPDVLRQANPEIVVVHGDRFDAMAVAISAAFMNVCVCHLEGGEITGTIDESIRHSVTKLAHLHLVCTEDARQRVISMGEQPDRVLNTGCPLHDEIRRLDLSEALAVQQAWWQRHPNTPLESPPDRFLLVLHHPVTSDIAASLEECEAISDAVMELAVPTILIYPNVDAGSKDMVRVMRLKGLETCDHVLCLKHVPSHEFLLLLATANCFIGNSSAGIREAGAFGTPVINIGNRQSMRVCGGNVLQMPKVTGRSLVEAIEAHSANRHQPCNLYGDGHAVDKMVHALSEVDVSATQKQYHSPPTANQSQ